ncbi:MULTISPECIES: ATP-grasp fold amidoligase family protein [Clostridia]|uniref:ATP-grasp fold amidoligase family protein n=1 Tax=Clostridia TaxID=186801 RepID=UPI00067E87BB|nr:MULTISPECIES: ATP-grasp fold amidoligase family protein [Clostridia]
MSIKTMCRSIINGAAALIGPENALKLEASLRFHKRIDLDSPHTLSDKICYLEFRKENPLSIICSDKYDVRAYIKSKGLGEILVPLIGDVYSDAESIEFEKLPQKFVLKATYGCSMNLICADKNFLNIEAAKQTVGEWLTKGFNRDTLEPHYHKIKKRIICEQFLENAESILDYKIHCFNGTPKFILVCSERDKGLKLNLYDLSWNPIHEIRGKYINTNEIAKPSRLKDMIKIAKTLSEDFDFVRVDLYQIKDTIYFGELTFTPDGGMLSYYTSQFDEKMGEQLMITEQ